mmetsp:Transcript_9128/g.20623  ORF Transcript_9128/g.20623 Transcript_9128/m.20623 type:complete len:84 (+) Transcript_9128:118-369(+)
MINRTIHLPWEISLLLHTALAFGYGFILCAHSITTIWLRAMQSSRDLVTMEQNQQWEFDALLCHVHHSAVAMSIQSLMSMSDY